MSFSTNNFLIPTTVGHAVSKGWTSWTGGKPLGVTWHWTAGRTLEDCRRLLGGPEAERKGVASAHYCVGRNFSEGIDRYVTLEDRSWHAGKKQILRWDGQPSNSRTKGARSTIGVETVALGFAREEIRSRSDWIDVYDTNSTWKMTVQPWTDEQYEMMILVGKEIIDRWPHIRPEHHHGHCDLCPGYKSDPAGLDFARLLSGIYDQSIPDIWSPYRTVTGRQESLIRLGYDLGPWGADGFWGDYSSRALSQFCHDHQLPDTGYWTSFVSSRIWRATNAS